MDELFGDIGEVCGERIGIERFEVDIIFPVAVRGMGVTGGGSGVGDPCGGDDSCHKACRFREFEEGGESVVTRFAGVGLIGGMIIFLHGLVDAEDALVGFHAGDHGGHGGGGIRDLLIGAERSCERDVWEGFEGELVLFAQRRSLDLLSFEDARGGDCGDAHSIADEEDDIFCGGAWRCSGLLFEFLEFCGEGLGPGGSGLLGWRDGPCGLLCGGCGSDHLAEKDEPFCAGVQCVAGEEGHGELRAVGGWKGGVGMKDPFGTEHTMKWLD